MLVVQWLWVYKKGFSNFDVAYEKCHKNLAMLRVQIILTPNCFRFKNFLFEYAIDLTTKKVSKHIFGFNNKSAR